MNKQNEVSKTSLHGSMHRTQFSEYTVVSVQLKYAKYHHAKKMRKFNKLVQDNDQQEKAKAKNYKSDVTSSFFFLSILVAIAKLMAIVREVFETCPLCLVKCLHRRQIYLKELRQQLRCRSAGKYHQEKAHSAKSTPRTSFPPF